MSTPNYETAAYLLESRPWLADNTVQCKLKVSPHSKVMQAKHCTGNWAGRLNAWLHTGDKFYIGVCYFQSSFQATYQCWVDLNSLQGRWSPVPCVTHLMCRWFELNTYQWAVGLLFFIIYFWKISTVLINRSTHLNTIPTLTLSLTLNLALTLNLTQI